MLMQPQFKPHYRWEAIEGEGLFLISELGSTVLKGRLYEYVVPLIDGCRSVDDLIEQLDGRATPAEVYYTLTQLEEKGYITEGNNVFSIGESAMWAAQGIDAQTAASRLADNQVSVTVFGEMADEPLREALRGLDVRVGELGQFGVVLADDYLRCGLRAYNREALRQEMPWLLVRPVGSQIWLGPLFRPGQTGCWECLALRLRANRSIECYVQERKGYADPLPIPRGFAKATLPIASNLAAMAIASWISHGKLPVLEGKVVSLDLVSFKTESHILVRLPQCPTCGQSALRQDGRGLPLVLTSRKKHFTEDGSHRAFYPQETLKRYGHHVSPITGLVAMLEPAPVSDGVVHVYIAGHNPARSAGNLAMLRRDLRSCSSGKGATDLQARASGLCEALERQSGVFRGDEPRRTARFKDLAGAALHPNACMLFSDRQYAERAEWNGRESKSNSVPVPFDPEAEMEWTPLWSLTRQEVRYLPTAFCYYNYPEKRGISSCRACSNGNAAGNTLEEAILQGFLELVERDAVALWWYNRIPRPGVNLDTFDEPYLRELSAYLRDRSRTLWVLDLTTDLGIPTFAALSRRLERPERILLGFGSHYDSRISILRAVTELNQMLTWILPQEIERKSFCSDTLEERETLHWLENATLDNQPYLIPDPKTKPRSAADNLCHWTDDLKEDVLACQALVERHGLEILVLDQTRADIGLPVVKVVVPGLRHFWPRFAPGRLYEVPVQLGWLPHQMHEQELNPTPMFL